jgi:hypothetical protein
LFIGPGPKQSTHGSPPPPMSSDPLISLLPPRDPTCQPLQALTRTRRPRAPRPTSCTDPLPSALHVQALPPISPLCFGARSHSPSYSLPRATHCPLQGHFGGDGFDPHSISSYPSTRDHLFAMKSVGAPPPPPSYGDSRHRALLLPSLCLDS